MALKALMLRKKLDGAKKELQILLEKRAAFEKQEAELRTALEELTEDSTDEERSTVETAIDEFEAENEENEETIRSLEETVQEIESELDAEEAAQENTPEPEEVNGPVAEERNHGEVNRMSTRTKNGMTYEQRSAFVQREEVQDFLHRTRECIQNKRALTNVGLTVPTSIIGLLRENVIEYSKLYKHVNAVVVNGTAREVVMGTVPEAVWTEMCANLNELDLNFYGAEVDGYKVGGYFAICNAMAEDNDVDLLDKLVETLGQSIGYALDKAIIYGTGTKMPLGIVTRLFQASEPADYPADARPWVDLSTDNVTTIDASVTGADLFPAIVGATAAMSGAYSRGEKTWVMNEATYTALVAAAINADASGAFVSGVNGTMPGIGGAIEVLSFIEDDVIIGGYFDLYLLAERAGTTISQSEHVRFIQDQTVLRGTARYDGLPVIAEGFVAIGINGTEPSSTVTFAPDTANSAESESGNDAK